MAPTVRGSASILDARQVSDTGTAGDAKELGGRTMAQEAWRAYLEAARGVTEASRAKATELVQQVVGGGVGPEQLRTLAHDLYRVGAANRDLLTRQVRSGLDRVLAQAGLARMGDVAALETRVGNLEEELRQARADAAKTPVRRRSTSSASTRRSPAAGTTPAKDRP
jgi:polyhydroxyalkanoate synthesis regulator phasin